MEKKNSNVYLGAILVVFGLIILAHNLNWVEFELTLKQVAQFWPFLLILAGVAVFLNPRRSIYNATSALLIAFAIPLSIYNCTSEGVDELKSELKDGIHIDMNDDDNEDSDNNNSGERVSQHFEVENTSAAEAKLDIEGGAAKFELMESSSKLFEADTKLVAGSYKLAEAKNGNVHEIDFSMNKLKDDNINIGFDDDGKGNVIKTKLNTNPVWDISLGFGAGKADLDLSQYKVKKLELQSGAAAIDLKLSDKLTESRVKIESGASKVTIKVPKGVGCEIRMDAALSSKDFDDFDKINDGKWQTSGFEGTAKKIYLDIDSGLSSVVVERY